MDHRDLLYFVRFALEGLAYRKLLVALGNGTCHEQYSRVRLRGRLKVQRDGAVRILPYWGRRLLLSSAHARHTCWIGRPCAKETDFTYPFAIDLKAEEHLNRQLGQKTSMPNTLDGTCDPAERAMTSNPRVWRPQQRG